MCTPCSHYVTSDFPHFNMTVILSINFVIQMAILCNFSLPTLHFESIASISPEKEPVFQNIHLLFSSRTCCLRKDITSVYKPSPGWWEKIYGQEVQWDCISMRNLKRQCSLTRKSDRSTFIFLRMLKIHFKKQLPVFPSSHSSTC